MQPYKCHYIIQCSIINRYLPVDGKFNQKLYEFLYATPVALESKYTVNVRPNGEELLCLFTFASTFEEAFQTAKSAYQASSYPKVGVDEFVVHGTCKSSTCPDRGKDHFVFFTIDWATSS
jgi:hypothetical protein